MSRELMEKEVMDAEHLKRILDQYKTTPQLSPGTRAGVLETEDEDTVAERSFEDERARREAGEGA
jgi:hypothetical protein